MRVLVCGGRDYDLWDNVCRVLDALNMGGTGIEMVIQGGAWGADNQAYNWCLSRKVPVLTVPADWDRHGKAAGHIRNTKMLDYGPALVVAFPGGRGTANMVAQAEKAGVPVEKVA